MASIDQYLAKEISLKHLELHLLNLPEKESFISSLGKRSSKQILIIKWIDKDNNNGYGECSCRTDPYYSAEFVDASIILIN